MLVGSCVNETVVIGKKAQAVSHEVLEILKHAQDNTSPFVECLAELQTSEIPAQECHLFTRHLITDTLPTNFCSGT